MKASKQSNKVALLAAEVEIIVPFHDVDLMGVAWHGHYVKYFELARCALLDKIDYDYMAMHNSGYAWPVIDMRIRYPQPALYNQCLRVRAELVEWENRLKINYQAFCKDTGKRLTRGYTIQVAVELKNREMCLESPEVLFRKLSPML